MEELFDRLRDWVPGRPAVHWPPVTVAPEEQHTLITLWAITRAPLFETEPFAPEAVLAVARTSAFNRQVVGGTLQVWAANGGPDRFVALFNRTDAQAEVSVPLRALWLESAEAVDLWSGERIGAVGERFARVLPARGAGLYRLLAS